MKEYKGILYNIACKINTAQVDTRLHLIFTWWMYSLPCFILQLNCPHFLISSQWNKNIPVKQCLIILNIFCQHMDKYVWYPLKHMHAVWTLWKRPTNVYWKLMQFNRQERGSKIVASQSGLLLLPLMRYSSRHMHIGPSHYHRYQPPAGEVITSPGRRHPVSRSVLQR